MVVKESREFAREIDLDLKTQFDGEMKNMENAQKLKRIAKEKGKKAIDTTWKSKPLHDQYPFRCQKADVDLHDTHQRLRSAGLKVETEEFIVTAQDQSLFKIFSIIFSIIGLTLGVNSAIQAPKQLTTLSQGSLFRPQMSIQTDTIVLDNIYTGKTVTIMLLKHSTNGVSINRYLS